MSPTILNICSVFKGNQQVREEDKAGRADVFISLWRHLARRTRCRNRQTGSPTTRDDDLAGKNRGRGEADHQAVIAATSVRRGVGLRRLDCVRRLGPQQGLTRWRAIRGSMIALPWRLQGGRISRGQRQAFTWPRNRGNSTCIRHPLGARNAPVLSVWRGVHGHTSQRGVSGAIQCAGTSGVGGRALLPGAAVSSPRRLPGHRHAQARSRFQGVPQAVEKRLALR
jgi:hypothetical protein